MKNLLLSIVLFYSTGSWAQGFEYPKLVKYPPVGAVYLGVSPVDTQKCKIQIVKVDKVEQSITVSGSCGYSKMDYLQDNFVNLKLKYSKGTSSKDIVFSHYYKGDAVDRWPGYDFRTNLTYYLAIKENGDLKWFEIMKYKSNSSGSGYFKRIK
jgi:hypothetical protein